MGRNSPSNTEEEKYHLESPRSPEKQVIPRRFPRIGGQFQTRIAKSTEPLNRPAPDRMSTAYPNVTEREVTRYEDEVSLDRNTSNGRSSCVPPVRSCELVDRNLWSVTFTDIVGVHQYGWGRSDQDQSHLADPLLLPYRFVSVGLLCLYFWFRSLSTDSLPSMLVFCHLFPSLDVLALIYIYPATHLLFCVGNISYSLSPSSWRQYC